MFYNAGREYGIKTGETLHKHLQWAAKIAALILRLRLEQLFRFCRALRRQRERNHAQHCQSNRLKEAHREQGKVVSIPLAGHGCMQSGGV